MGLAECTFCTISNCAFTIKAILILFFPYLLFPQALNANEISEMGDWKIKGILSALDDSIPGVRVRALEKLGQVELPNSSFANVKIKLNQLLTDDDSDVRWAAVGALLELGDAAKSEVPNITKGYRNF